MISDIRHNISLLLCLFGIVTGLVIAAIGLFTFVGGVFMLNAMSTMAETGRPTRWDAPIGIVLSHAVTALAGLALTYFAGRGFGDRWRAGPPTDESIVEKTNARRMLALAIYGAGAVYGAYGLVFGIEPIMRDLRLLNYGVATTASVVSIAPAPELHEDLDRITYQFRTRSGEMVTGSGLQFSHTAQKAVALREVEVTYDVNDPALSKIDFHFSMPLMLQFFIGQLVFVLVGIWGFAKNTQSMRWPDEPDAFRPPPPPPVRPLPPQPIRAQSSGPPVFGRRKS